jgi:hypothetical protein
MTTSKPPDHLGSQHLEWLLVAELEMAPPQWGRPLRPGDIRAMAHDFDPDKLGAIAVWARKTLPVGRGKFVICDGQHRVAATRLALGQDQRVPCLVYEGLTMETAAELSLGLQERRNLHPLDKHRAALAAHDLRAVDVDKILTVLALHFVYTAKATDRGRISAVGACYQVWDRMSSAGLERVLIICSQAWDRTSGGFASPVLKLVMTVLAAHDGQVDDVHLGETLATRSPAQWVSKDVVPRRPIASLAQDVVIEYNKIRRGAARLVELTPSQYEAAAKRKPQPTVRGKIEGRTTATKSTSAASTRSRRTRKPT